MRANESGNSPDSTTAIFLAPALDYFVIDSLSLGAQVLFGWSKAGDSKSTTVGLEPRIGYAVPINAQLSFWPTAGIAYSTSSFSPGDSSSSRLTLPIVSNRPATANVSLDSSRRRDASAKGLKAKCDARRRKPLRL